MSVTIHATSLLALRLAPGISALGTLLGVLVKYLGTN